MANIWQVGNLIIIFRNLDINNFQMEDFNDLN